MREKYLQQAALKAFDSIPERNLLHTEYPYSLLRLYLKMETKIKDKVISGSAFDRAVQFLNLESPKGVACEHKYLAGGLPQAFPAGYHILVAINVAASVWDREIEPVKQTEEKMDFDSLIALAPK